MTALCPWIWKHDYTLQNLDKMPHGESTFGHHVTTFQENWWISPCHGLPVTQSRKDTWFVKNLITELPTHYSSSDHLQSAWRLFHFPTHLLLSTSQTTRTIVIVFVFICFNSQGLMPVYLKNGLWCSSLKKKKKKALKTGVNTTYSHIGGISPSEWGRLAFMWMSTRYHTGGENLWNLGPI